MRTSTLRTVLICGTVVLTAAILSHAGPLDPPAGPVAPSYKTLTEVEPRTAISAASTPGDADSQFKITQPGSYYLTGNITGRSGKHGIEIAASEVTLDLNGFSLHGVAGSLNGVTVNINGPSRIRVMNGTVEAWGLAGVDLAFGNNDDCLVESIRATGNGDIGIAVRNRTVIRGCIASGNASRGILAVVSCSISDCVSEGNAVGISAGTGTTLISCIAASNTGDGYFGSTTEGGMTFTNCSAAKNGGRGFFLNPCTGNTLVGCTAYRNSQDGFVLNSGCSITDSTSHENGGFGFDITSGCMIRSCNARLNFLDGIRASSNAMIRDNSCISNGQDSAGGAGIHTTGADNRIEGNNCCLNDRGIDVDVAGSIIFRNTCSGNGINWALAANNVFGPIVDRIAPASGAVNGNSAADSSANTNPNANFSY